MSTKRGADQVFANDEQKMSTLTQWLSSSDMNYFKKNIMGKQYETIKSLTNEYRQNIRKSSKDIKERLKLMGDVSNYGGAATLAWAHNPDQGLADNTRIDPDNNIYQLTTYRYRPGM